MCRRAAAYSDGEGRGWCSVRVAVELGISCHMTSLATRCRVSRYCRKKWKTVPNYRAAATVAGVCVEFVEIRSTWMIALRVHVIVCHPCVSAVAFLV